MIADIRINKTYITQQAIQRPDKTNFKQFKQKTKKKNPTNAMHRTKMYMYMIYRNKRQLNFMILTWDR